MTTPPVVLEWTTDLLNGSANFTGSCPSSTADFYERYCPERTLVDKVVTPFIYCIGFPGNLMSILIWMQRRMRHSSGYYLAALALADMVFLSLHVLFELHEVWQVNTLDVPVFCESFTVIFLAFQYLSPLLVLGFTVERYISICHPFKRETYCTTKRAKIVIVSLAVFSLWLCGIQGYFWTYDYKSQKCTIREEVAKGGVTSFWSIWTWVTEALIFLLVPLLVLLFNVLVIKEAQRLSEFEQTHLSSSQSRSHGTSATTIMLLAVSFYLIITTLPVTVVYALYFSFPSGDESIACTSLDTDEVWKSHFSYLLVRKIIEEIGMTHYACNFYIYLITGKVFRREFVQLLKPLFTCCMRIKTNWPSEYTSLRAIQKGISGNGSPNTVVVRFSTNGHTANNCGETNV